MGIPLLISLWIVLFIISSAVSDDLLKHQHEHYREEWKHDGSPRGMFYNPKSSSCFPYAWPKNLINSLGLKGARPVWIDNEDETALKLWKRVKLTEKVVKYYFLALFPLIILIKCTGL